MKVYAQILHPYKQKALTFTSLAAWGILGIQIIIHEPLHVLDHLLCTEEKTVVLYQSNS
jgi:hypothetical protein